MYGKIQITLPMREFVISLDKADNVDLAVNDAAELLQATTFTIIQDPYDRMFIAPARVASLPLITGDAKIHDSALIRAVWN